MAPEGDDSMHKHTIVEGVMGGTIGAVAVALVLANLLAGLIMLGFFFRRHRSTWHAFLVPSE